MNSNIYIHIFTNFLKEKEMFHMLFLKKNFAYLHITNKYVVVCSYSSMHIVGTTILQLTCPYSAIMCTDAPRKVNKSLSPYFDFYWLDIPGILSSGSFMRS